MQLATKSAPRVPTPWKDLVELERHEHLGAIESTTKKGRKGKNASGKHQEGGMGVAPAYAAIHTSPAFLRDGPSVNLQLRDHCALHLDDIFSCFQKALKSAAVDISALFLSKRKRKRDVNEW